MSDAAQAAEAGHGRALARFAEHRRAWQGNEALRILYARWYGAIRDQLPPPDLGPRIELGSGPGFAREFIPDMLLTDLVAAPWLDRQMAAETLPDADGSVGALVLFDVLHHLSAPARFFAEASRVLRPGGRIVMCEPHISAVSYPVYRFLHAEDVVLGADPYADHTRPDKDPFEANQAIPTLIFGRGRREFERRFAGLRIRRVRHLSGLSYPASGGFSRQPFLPLPLWRALLRAEDFVPEGLFRLAGFRLLAVIQKD